MNLHPDQLRHRAMSFIQARQFTDALAVFELLLPLSDHTLDYLWRAKMNLAIGNYSDALSDYQIVLTRKPNERSALHHSALIRAASPDDDDRDGILALVLATRALETTNSNDWMILSGVAAAHAECGDFVRAAEFANQTLENAPDEYRIRFSQRLEQYKRQEPFRLTPDCVQQQMKSDPKTCAKCGAPTFFSIPDSDDERICLCLRCAECDFGAGNATPK